MKTLMTAMALGLMAPLPALAQDLVIPPSQPVVVVTGRGTASRPPDYGNIEVLVLGEGDSQVEALSALEAQRARLVDGLGHLENAQVTVQRTTDVRIERVMGPDCEADDYNLQRSTGVCEPQGFAATMTIDARVAPADRTGAAASLAAELGSTRVSVDGYGVNDFYSLRNEAARAAYDNARQQAELMAVGSGGTLGRVLRIQNGSANSGATYDESDQVASIVITGSRVRRPSVELAVTPAPVEATATLGVIFELVP